MVQVCRSVYQAMLAHVLETPTLESCGLLSGKQGRITRLFQATNVAENKAVRYEAEPLDVRRILEEIDEAGEEHLGIYHSHPNSQAYPSATDRRLAAYDVHYIVISLRNRHRPEARAFQICKAHPSDPDAEVHEEPLEIVDDPA
ncbi:MAG: Mov34/MPN/PAD-1 family protein [Chloroflexota bacterium]